MQTSNLNAFEEYLRKKEIELSLLNSQAISDSSGSYSTSPLLNFSRRIKEFDHIEESSKVTKIIKRNKKTIYTLSIVSLSLFTLYLIA